MNRVRLVGILAVLGLGGCGERFWCGLPGAGCEKAASPDGGAADARLDAAATDLAAADTRRDVVIAADTRIDSPLLDMASDLSRNDVSSPSDGSSPADRPAEVRADGTVDLVLRDSKVDLGSDVRTDAAGEGGTLTLCCPPQRQCGPSPNTSPNCAGVQCGANCPGPTCGICGAGLDCNDGTCTAGCSTTVRVINSVEIPDPIENGCGLFPYLVVQAGTSQSATWVGSLGSVDIRVKQGQTGTFTYQCCWTTVPACTYDPTNCTIPGFGPAVCSCYPAQSVSVTATSCGVEQFVACQ